MVKWLSMVKNLIGTNSIKITAELTFKVNGNDKLYFYIASLLT